jgi:cobalt-zinc-cadmium efflux system membrane fusion protein
VPAYPDEVFHGAVSYIGDRVDETTRTITVRSEVDNTDGRLKPGMFAHVEILLNGTTTALAVRKDAVLQDGDRKTVFVVDGDGYRLREVETGPPNGSYVTIVKGLSEGDQVVVEGNFQLRSILLQDRLQAEHSH